MRVFGRPMHLWRNLYGVRCLVASFSPGRASEAGLAASRARAACALLLVFVFSPMPRDKLTSVAADPATLPRSVPKPPTPTPVNVPRRRFHCLLFPFPHPSPPYVQYARHRGWAGGTGTRAYIFLQVCGLVNRDCLMLNHMRCRAALHAPRCSLLLGCSSQTPMISTHTHTRNIKMPQKRYYCGVWCVSLFEV
jgi:hypothetical protein